MSLYEDDDINVPNHKHANSVPNENAMTPPEIALCERLLERSDQLDDLGLPLATLINPDGPDAAAMITALVGEREGLAKRVAELEAILKPFADVAINVPFEPDTEIVVWVPANERNGGRWTAHMPAENFIDARATLEGNGK